MNEDIKQTIRKKRGAPRKQFAKNPDDEQTQETEQLTQNNKSMETPNTGGKDEFLNDIGSENEAKSTPVTEVVSATTTTPDDTGIKTDAAFVDEVSKNTTDPLLADNLAPKDYAKGLTDTSNIPTEDIPQANFVMPKGIVDDAPPPKTEQIPKAEPIQPLNKDAETLSPAEKRAGAQLTVEAFWSGYNQVNELLGNWLQYPIDKRIKMHHADELDLNMKVQVSVDGTQITINEFYDQLNEDTKAVFAPNPKLKERLFEPMCREAEKLGLVMTDRQFIIKELGQDVITKAVQVISIKSAMNNFTTDMKKQYAQNKKENEEKIKEESERRKKAEERAARLIDEDTEEGMAKIYDWYKKLREMEGDGVEKAQKMTEQFRKQAEAEAEAAHEHVEHTQTEKAPKKETPTSTEIQVRAEEVKE